MDNITVVSTGGRYRTETKEVFKENKNREIRRQIKINADNICFGFL
jgi:hypothetical protein